jgi:hypothetical protein
LREIPLVFVGDGAAFLLLRGDRGNGSNADEQTTKQAISGCVHAE